jgi:hypothetical protein
VSEREQNKGIILLGFYVNQVKPESGRNLSESRAAKERRKKKERNCRMMQITFAPDLNSDSWLAIRRTRGKRSAMGEEEEDPARVLSCKLQRFDLCIASVNEEDDMHANDAHFLVCLLRGNFLAVAVCG